MLFLNYFHYWWVDIQVNNIGIDQHTSPSLQNIDQ